MPNGRSAKADDAWDGEEEYAPLIIPPEFRSLEVEESKATVRELWQRFLSRELVLQPDFQRHYVWDATRASRYIESLLLALPTPPIFLAEEQDGTWAIVDGHQRLETLFRFMQPLLSGPIKAAGRGDRPTYPLSPLSPLRLRALEVLSEINGKDVTALSVEDRGQLWGTALSLIRLPRSTHRDMKYVLFARLNQGSMSLNAQELRNCLFRGPYNNLIAELSESRDFLTLWGRREPDQRMRQREMILRMFALIHRRDRYRTPFRAFLNDEMADHRDLGDGTESRFRDEFTNAIRWIDRIFGTESLRLFRMGNGDEPSGRWIRRRYDLVYEVEAVGFGSLGSKLNQIYDSIDYRDQRAFCTSMRSRLVTVMTKEQFVETLREGTTRPNVLRRRFELWLGPLHQAIADPDAFIRRGHELLECLNNPVCTKCPQPVAVDDAVLKSTGTRLAIEHRYCGSSKN